jgi:hypothetical protein
MKVAFAENNVVGARGLTETGGFSIKASAHAFKMLSSGLYSDKIRAVLREIGCNAMDAHIAAGDPNKPFRVKLPNALDDQFYIQDWGPGLAHEDVMGLYTTYFSSTKQDSDEFTGAFGLGSKSPFSYTDSFSVVSTFGGKKRTYSLYLSNQGAPMVSLMAEEDPDEDWAHGVRVGFAVKPQDYEEFKLKAQMVFSWFRVVPEVRGTGAVKPQEYKFECPEFALLKNGSREHVTAVMGNVAYPVDLLQLGVASADKKDPLAYAASVPGLVLRLPIGAVQVAASREQLQYDPASLKAMREITRHAVKLLGKDVVAALEAAADDGSWEALCECEQLTDTMLAGMRYEFADFAAAMQIDPKRVKVLERFVGRSSAELNDKIGAGTSCFVVRKYAGTPKVRLRDTYDGRRVEFEKNTAILAGDVERARSRALRAVQDGHFDQVLVIGRGSSIRPTPATIAAEAALASAELGRMRVLDLKDYPPHDIVVGASKKRRKKGWVPTLPAGIEFPCIVGKAEEGKELKDVDPLFACRIESTRWSRTTEHMRVFHTTAEDDKRLEWDDWELIWHRYQDLQAKAQLANAPASHAVLSAAQIKSIGLTRIGWGNAFEAVARYMERKDLQAALRARIKRKHLLAPEDISTAQGWMTSLAWALGTGLLTATEQHDLGKLKLLPQLKDMVAARAAAKKAQREPDVPPEIEHYQWLCSRFGLENGLATDLRSALTVEDLDAAFLKRFPLASHVGHYGAVRSSDRHEILKFIFSKEV